MKKIGSKLVPDKTKCFCYTTIPSSTAIPARSYGDSTIITLSALSAIPARITSLTRGCSDPRKLDHFFQRI